MPADKSGKDTNFYFILDPKPEFRLKINNQVKSNFDKIAQGIGFLKFLIRYPLVVIFTYIAIVLTLFVVSSAYYADLSRKKMAHDVVRTYLLSIATLHKYYSKEIVPRARSAGAEFAADYKTKSDKIPFPGTIAMDFGEMLGNAKPGLDTNLYSHYPFPWRQRQLDNFERDSLAFLEANPGSSFTQFLNIDGVEIIRYAEPVLMQPDCVECHNRDEFYFGKNWSEGEFRGARQVSIPISLVMASDKTFYLTGALLGLVAAFLGAGLIWPLVLQMRAALEGSRKLNDELDLRVEQRTNELYIAKEEAERASNAKSEFLSRMSHEMRTPLHAILGFGQILHRKIGRKDFDPHKGTQQIISSGRHLLHLVEDVLSLGEIEKGNLEIVESVIPLRRVIDESLDIVEPMCAEAQLRLIDKTVNLELPEVRVDPFRLKQVLINLLSNAIKYNIEHGQIVIDWEAGKESVKLKITNTGKGIPKEKEDELFQPFFRLADNVSSIRGAGIGLTISRHLMESMQGSIGFESKPDEETTFWILIPLALAVDT